MDKFKINDIVIITKNNEDKNKTGVIIGINCNSVATVRIEKFKLRRYLINRNEIEKLK